MAPQQSLCPHCRRPLAWSQINQQWYCSKCELFIQGTGPPTSLENLHSEVHEIMNPTARPSVPVCQFCGAPLNLIPNYNRWYCYNCARWV